MDHWLEAEACVLSICEARRRAFLCNAMCARGEMVARSTTAEDATLLASLSLSYMLSKSPPYALSKTEELDSPTLC